VIAPTTPTVTATSPTASRRPGEHRGRYIPAVRVVVLAVYVGNIVLANWTPPHFSPLEVGTIAVSAGTLWAGLGFTLRDGLQEALGGRGVLGAIAAGAALSWLLASPQIAVASVLAFTISELAGSRVYGRLRGWSVLGAVIGSNRVGLGIDSALFVPLAFGGFALVPGHVLGKTIATMFTIVSADEFVAANPCTALATAELTVLPTESGWADRSVA
jgi:queuosine precursor transporter